MLIAAPLSRTGTPAQILLSWIRGKFELVVSPNLLKELRAVLLRPKFRKYVTGEEVSAYLTLLEQRTSMVVDPEPSPGLTSAPGDDYLVALARAAAAHFLVSGDPHLTGVRGSHPPIVTPRTFLSTLGKNESSGGD